MTTAPAQPRDDIDRMVEDAGRSLDLKVSRGMPGIDGRLWRIQVDVTPRMLRLTRPLHPSEGEGTTSVLTMRSDPATAERLIRCAIRDMKRLQDRGDALEAAGYDVADPPEWSVRAHPVVIAALHDGDATGERGWLTDHARTGTSRRHHFRRTGGSAAEVTGEFRIVGDRIVDPVITAVGTAAGGDPRPIYEFRGSDDRGILKLYGFCIPQTLISSFIGKPIGNVVRMECSIDAIIVDIDVGDEETILYTDHTACWVADLPPGVDNTWRD